MSVTLVLHVTAVGATAVGSGGTHAGFLKLEEAYERPKLLVDKVNQIAVQLLPGVREFRITYLDDQGDRCTLSEGTAQDALDFAVSTAEGQADRTLKLEVARLDEVFSLAQTPPAALPASASKAQAEERLLLAAAPLLAVSAVQAVHQLGLATELSPALGPLKALAQKLQDNAGTREAAALAEAWPQDLREGLGSVAVEAAELSQQAVERVAEYMQEDARRIICELRQEGYSMAAAPFSPRYPSSLLEEGRRLTFLFFHSPFAAPLGAAPLGAAPLGAEDRPRPVETPPVLVLKGRASEPATQVPGGLPPSAPILCDGCSADCSAQVRYTSTEWEGFVLCQRCHDKPLEERQANTGVAPGHAFQKVDPRPAPPAAGTSAAAALLPPPPAPLPSAPPSSPVLAGAATAAEGLQYQCDGCGDVVSAGVVFRSLERDNYDLCTDCHGQSDEYRRQHFALSPDHRFKTVQAGVSQPAPSPSAAEDEEQPIFVCDGCRMYPIVGVRYSSTVREYVDLCEECYSKHLKAPWIQDIEPGHPFKRVAIPGPRAGSQQVPASPCSPHVAMFEAALEDLDTTRVVCAAVLEADLREEAEREAASRGPSPKSAAELERATDGRDFPTGSWTPSAPAEHRPASCAERSFLSQPAAAPRAAEPAAAPWPVAAVERDLPAAGIVSFGDGFAKVVQTFRRPSRVEEFHLDVSPEHAPGEVGKESCFEEVVAINEKEVSRLREELRAARQSESELQEKLHSARAEVERLQGENQFLQEQADSGVRALEDKVQTAEELVQRTQEVHRLEAECRRLKLENDDLAPLANAGDRALKELRAAQEAEAALRTGLEAKEAENQHLSARMDALQAELATIKSDPALVQASIQAEMAATSAQNTQLALSVEGLQAEVTKLRDELLRAEAATRDLHVHSRELAEITQIRDDLAVELREAQAMLARQAQQNERMLDEMRLLREAPAAREQAGASARVLGVLCSDLGAEATEDQAARGEVTADFPDLLANTATRQAFRIGRVHIGDWQNPVPASVRVAVQNDGEATWPATTVLVHLQGDTLGLPTLALGALGPGDAAEIVLDLQLPPQAEEGEEESLSAWALSDAATGVRLGPLLLFQTRRAPPRDDL